MSRREPTAFELSFVRKYGANVNLKVVFPVNASVTDECFGSDTPSFITACGVLGKGNVNAWIVLALAYINEMVGPEKKMSIQQISSIAEIVLTEYGYMHFDEFLYFGKQVRMGTYGKFYGNVDPQVICGALKQFNVEMLEKRKAVIDRREAEERNNRRKMEEKNAVSYEEYLALKKRAEDGDDEARRKINGQG